MSDFKERVRRLLLRVEYQAFHLSDGTGYVHICPICNSYSTGGHTDDCEWAALFKETQLTWQIDAEQAADLADELETQKDTIGRGGCIAAA